MRVSVSSPRHSEPQPPFFLHWLEMCSFTPPFLPASCTLLYLVSPSLLVPLALLAFCLTKPADSQPLRYLSGRDTYMPGRLSPISATAHFFHRGETLSTKVAFLKSGHGVANTRKLPYNCTHESCLSLSLTYMVVPCCWQAAGPLYKPVFLLDYAGDWIFNHMIGGCLFKKICCFTIIKVW